MSLFHRCTFQSTGLYKLQKMCYISYNKTERNVQHKRALKNETERSETQERNIKWLKTELCQAAAPPTLVPFTPLSFCFFQPAHVHPIKSYYSSRTCTHQAKSCSSKQTQTTAQTPEAPSCSFTFTLVVFDDERLLTDSHCE